MNPIAPTHETAAMLTRPEQLVQHIRRLASPSAASSDADSILLDHFVARQDEESFAALVRRHGPMVLGVCRRILGNAHDAEDAYQAAFLVLARKAATVKPRHALAAWLYGVARRVALKARGANIRRTRGKRPLATPADPHASPLDELSGRELLAIFEEELQRLPSAYRLPLILCCLEGHSQEEVARQLGWTPGSVKGRLERGRARLHGRLTRRGLTLAAALMTVEAARGSAATLTDSTARLALRFARGSAEGMAATLAEGTLRGMAWGKATILAGMLAAMTAFAGAGALGVQALTGKPPEKTESNATPAEQPREEAPRTDRHGDPLPPGAIARLGTLRFRGANGCLSFSPDGKRLAAATGTGEHITLWDAATGREIWQLAGRTTLTRLVFSPDGRRLVTSDNSRNCRVVDAETGKKLFELSGTHGVFSADGKAIVTCQAGASSVVRSWDARTGKMLLAKEFPLNIREFVAAGDGRTLAAVESPNGPVFVKVLDLAKGTEVRSFALAWNGLTQLTLTADGKTLASTNLNKVCIWDMADGKMIDTWNHRNVSQAVFSPDGKRVAWTGLDEKGGFEQLWVAERGGGKPRAVGSSDVASRPPCFSPDGKQLAVVTSAGVLSVRDLASGKEVLTNDAHTGPIMDVAFEGDGRHVISQDRTNIFVWEALTGRLLRRQSIPPEKDEAILFRLPAGRLVTIQRRRNVEKRRDEDLYRLREMRTGREVFRFEGWPGGGPRVMASGGRYLALRGPAGDLRVLDLQTRQEWSLLKSSEAGHGLKLSADGNVAVWYDNVTEPRAVHVHRHDSSKTFVLRDLPRTDRWHWIFENVPCVSPDGRWLVLNTEAGRLRRWDLTTGEEVSPLLDALRTSWEFVWSPDGRFVAVRGSATQANLIDREALRDIRVWNVRTGKRLTHLTVPNRNGGMRVHFTPDSRTLVTTDLLGIIHLREVITGKDRLTLKGHLSGGIGAWTLSADGRMLVSGGFDSQGFVWDLTGRMPDGQWRSVRHPPEKLRSFWDALASDDAAAAYAAMWQMAADPEGSTTFLREHLKPVALPKAGQVARLIAALDSENFEERQRATRELEKLEESAAAELQQTLKGKPTLEVRRRVEALLARLERVPSGEQLRALRAIEALEHIGTAKARDVLRRLAEGAPAACVTREARMARARLGIAD